MLVGQADYPTHGPTHRPLNPEVLISILKTYNWLLSKKFIWSAKAMLDAYLVKTPSIICLKKDGLPFL